MEVDREEIVNFASNNEDDSSDYDDDNGGIGNPMLEVFGVKINCEGHLYGTITAGNLSDPQKLFDRESTNSQSFSMVGDDNILLLSGPSDSILAFDEVLIDVDLTHRDSPIPTEDKIEWKIGLHPYYNASVRDKPSYMEIHGNNGKFATVFYAVFNNAAKAALEIRLLPVDDGDEGNQNQLPVGLYGLVAASSDMITGDDYERVLFQSRKDSGQVIEVRPGEPIPLASPVVAVPLNWNLIVRADLFSKDGANFCAKSSFRAKVAGTSEKYIDGEYARIQLSRRFWILCLKAQHSSVECPGELE